MARANEDTTLWTFNGIHHNFGLSPAQIRAEKLLLHPVEPHLIALCPAIDLVAVATGKNQVDCFRFDGHRAFSYRRATKDAVSSIAWTYHVSHSAFVGDAVHLCIAWEDGRLDFLTSAGERRIDISFSNVIDRYIVQATEQHQPIRFIASAKYTTRKRKQIVKPHSVTPNIVHVPNGQSTGTAVHKLVNRYAGVFDEKHDHTVGTLPTQLASLDILEELPPLGALTLGAADSRSNRSESSVFTSQSAVDNLLNSGSNILERPVNLLFTSSERGEVHCHFDDSVAAGRFQLASDNAVRHIIAHASHRLARCHAFLTRSEASQSGCELSLSLVSLGCLSGPGHVLPQVIDMSRRLVYHCQYIAQTVVDLRQTYQTMQRLPSRLIENATEALQEAGSGLALPAALYRLAVTGNCVLAVRDWLVDQMGPAQHKRWDTTVDTGYRTLQELMLGCLLPAVDRTSVITSRLRVLSRMQPRYLDVRDGMWDDHIKHLDGIRLLGHAALKHTRVELAQFRVFSPWLLLQIQGQAAENGSATAAELSERAGAVDYAQLLPYITGLLSGSKLEVFLAGEPQRLPVAEGAGNPVAAARLAEIAQSHTAGADPQSSELDLLLHTDHLLHHLSLITSQLAVSSQSGVHILQGMTVDRECSGIADVRVVFDEQTQLVTTYVLTVPAKTINIVAVNRIIHIEAPEHRRAESDNGWIKSWSTVAFRFTNAKILDLKILDDEYCAVLVQYPRVDAQQIVRLAYTARKQSDAGSGLVEMIKVPCYTTNTDNNEKHYAAVGRPAEEGTPIIEKEEDPTEVLHMFNDNDSGVSFTPATLQAVWTDKTKHLLTLDEDKKKYKVIDAAGPEMQT